jgi:uncharacterized tellurite resistance protein B-like protein
MALLSQLKLLVSLAKIDNELVEKEREFIRNIAKANGFSEQHLSSLLDETHAMTVPDDLNNHEKFNYIFTLVQLMKIDEKLYSSEIKYCAQVASRLGYDKQVMFELMLNVKSASMSDDEVEALRNLTEKYLGHH